MAAGSALNADGITPKQEAAIIAPMNEATHRRDEIRQYHAVGHPGRDL